MDNEVALNEVILDPDKANELKEAIEFEEERPLDTTLDDFLYLKYDLLDISPDKIEEIKQILKSEQGRNLCSSMSDAFDQFAVGVTMPIYGLTISDNPVSGIDSNWLAKGQVQDKEVNNNPGTREFFKEIKRITEELMQLINQNRICLKEIEQFYLRDIIMQTIALGTRTSIASGKRLLSHDGKYYRGHAYSQANHLYCDIFPLSELEGTKLGMVDKEENPVQDSLEQDFLGAFPYVEFRDKYADLVETLCGEESPAPSEAKGEAKIEEEATA